MRTHDFLAECSTCEEITFWRKANQHGGHPDDPVERGFRCVECGTFHEQVEDTRGRVQVREAS